MRLRIGRADSLDILRQVPHAKFLFNALPRQQLPAHAWARHRIRELGKTCQAAPRARVGERI